MNDFNNYNIIKPKNVEELFKIILEIITRLYEKYIPDEVKYRKNKQLAKMSDAENETPRSKLRGIFSSDATQH